MGLRQVGGESVTAARRIGLLAAALLCLGSGAARAQIDPFYLDLEREAQVAAGRGDATTAARLYRVACFGMLDEPVRLAACTVRLAKAQDAAKDVEGFRASFLRLASVEERFQGLTRAGFSPEETQAFARVAAARLSAEELALIPALAELIAAERAQALAAANASAAKRAKPRGRRAAPSAEAPAATEVEAPAAAATGPAASTPTPTVSAVTGAGEVVEPVAGQFVEEQSLPSDDLGAAAVPAPESAPGPAASSSDRERLDAARRRIAERPERPAVEAELEAVREIADRNPGDAEAARLAGDLAYLLGLWPVCADYYQRAGDPGPELPLGRFYMAVCLFETGQAESAARIVAPSADRLQRSPFVDGYLTRILGSPTSP